MPVERPQPVTPPQSGRWVTVLIVLVGLTALAAFLFLRLPADSLRLNTCFQNANDLRPGARVQVAGVDVGTVRDVRAQPNNKACPAAVAMELRTPYELKIPNDSVASTATAGLLGETYLEIDASAASGPPVKSGGLLPSKESVRFTAATVDRALKAVDERVKQLSEEEKKNSSAHPSKAQQIPKPSPEPSAPK